MRVLFVTSSPFPEGLGDSVRVRHEVITLLKEGNDVWVLTFKKNGNLYGSIIKEVNLVSLPRTISKLVRNQNIELVLAHPQLVAWIALKNLPSSIPLIADFHDPLEPRFFDRKKLGISWNNLTWKLMMDIEQEVISKADGIVCTNMRVENWLIDKGGLKEKICIVPNGVPSSYLNVEKQRTCEDKIFAVFLGNMSKIFDFDLLLSVIHYVIKENRFINFKFIGRGPLRFSLEALENKHPGRISIEKWVSAEQLPSLLASCDIALHSVSCSYHGFYACHMKTFEYMGVGLPIVATDMDYSVEIAKQANCCVSSICGNKQTFLKNFMVLAYDVTMRKILGSNGKRFSKDLVWNKVTRSLTEFIKFQV